MGSVNKMRGPLSGQPKKIGHHAYELIDHVFYSEGLELVEHVLEPRVHPSRAAAIDDLIPSLSNPSDHYPVVVDIVPVPDLCSFASKSRSWKPQEVDGSPFAAIEP